MASMEAMRTYIAGQYSGRWPERVRKMPDCQVAAIYHNMQKELEGVKKRTQDPRITETEVAGGLQLSFFEGSGRRMKIKEEYLNERADEAVR